MEPGGPKEPTRGSGDFPPELYDELHALAARWMREQRKDHTLQATALVNEAYLRLHD